MFDTNTLVTLAATVVAGAVIGLLYFWGLWWTVSRMPQADRPLRLYFGSLIVRLAIALPLLYIVLNFSSWLTFAGSLVGFFLARLVMIRIVGRVPSDHASQREAV